MVDGNGSVAVEEPKAPEAAQEHPLVAKIKTEQEAIQKLASELEKAKATVEKIETTIRVRQGRASMAQELLQEAQAASGEAKVDEKTLSLEKGRKARRAGIQ